MPLTARHIRGAPIARHIITIITRRVQATVVDWGIPSGKYSREIIMPGTLIPHLLLNDQFALIVPLLRVLLIQARQIAAAAAVEAVAAEVG